jgi:hypothetical protein
MRRLKYLQEAKIASNSIFSLFCSRKINENLQTLYSGLVSSKIPPSQNEFSGCLSSLVFSPPYSCGTAQEFHLFPTIFRMNIVIVYKFFTKLIKFIGKEQ